jgi:hypothetical protein
VTVLTVPHLVTVLTVPHLVTVLTVPHLVTVLTVSHLVMELYPHWLSLEKERNPMPQNFQNLPRSCQSQNRAFFRND